MFNFFKKTLNTLFSPLILNRVNSIALVFSFFALWLSVFLDEQSEGVLSYLIIFSIGILHGANDMFILRRTKQRNKGFIKTLMIYILQVLVTAFLFFQFIPIATFLFILLSAHHFGEQHWSIRLNLEKGLGFLYHGVYGILIFSMLFYINADQSILILEDLTSIKYSEYLFLSTLVSSACVWLGMSIYFYFKVKRSPSFWIKEVFILTLLALIFFNASLIWAFAIYFVLWHSLPSLISQLLHLYGNASAPQLLKYIKSSLIYWMGALLFLGILLHFFKGDHKLFISILVAFLAAITVPHALVMSKMFKEKF